MSKIVYYTGIGSRTTPLDVTRRMTAIAKERAARGEVLRSGGADRADLAFEEGAGDRKEIYLPWRGFNGSRSDLFHTSPEAFEIAASIHPAWRYCSPGAQKLHARNVHQVLGRNLRTPSMVVICWTPGGGEVGGTRTAIVLARQRGIEVVNLWGST